MGVTVRDDLQAVFSSRGRRRRRHRHQNTQSRGGPHGGP